MKSIRSPYAMARAAFWFLVYRIFPGLFFKILPTRNASRPETPEVGHDAP